MAKLLTYAAVQDILRTWLCRRIGYRGHEDMRCIGIARDGRINAVVGFDNFNGSAVEMHVASDGTRRWMNKALLRAAFDYAFRVCSAKVAIGRVPSGNTEAVSMNLKLGFKNVARIEHGHPDGALYIMTMRREDCRYLKD